PPVLINQAQPDPKRPTPAALNCSRNFAKSPNALLIAAPRLPPGSPPALGAMICQNIEWFQWPPPLFRIAVRTASGSLLAPCIRSSRDLLAISAALSIAGLGLLT